MLFKCFYVRTHLNYLFKKYLLVSLLNIEIKNFQLSTLTKKKRIR